MARKERPKRRWLGIVIGAAAIVVALEIIGQIAGRPVLPPASAFTTAREWSHPDQIARDERLFWRYRPGQVIRNRFLLPGSYTINSRGFRTPEFAEAKPAGIERVVCLGESNALGEGVSDEAAWPRVLERELKQRDPQKRNWEVINLAVSNYSSHQGAILAEDWIPRLKPDVVLFDFSWADHQQAAFGVTDAELAAGPAWWLEVGNALAFSALVRWGEYLWMTVFPPAHDATGGYPLWRVSSTDFTVNMERICRAALAVGARPICVTSPIAWPPPGYADDQGIFHYHHRYRRLARYGSTLGGGKFVELATAFDDHPEFYDDPRRDFQHFNARGHAFAGAFLADCILGAPTDTVESRR